MQPFSYRVVLKKKILNTLISRKGYLTSTKIMELINDASVDTIQTLCHELNHEYLEANQVPLLDVQVGEGFRFIGNLELIPSLSKHYLSKILTTRLFQQASLITLHLKPLA